MRFRPLSNRYLSSRLAVAAIAFFAFYEVDGRAAGLALWQLFGSTNQLLAGLAPARDRRSEPVGSPEIELPSPRCS